MDIWAAAYARWAICCAGDLPTPLPSDPIVVRDIVSPWVFVSVAALAALVTLTLTVLFTSLRRRSRPPGPDR